MNERNNFELDSSGKYGDEGEKFMLAMAYTYAGVLILMLFGIVGCCLVARPAGTYAEEDEEELGGDVEEKPMSIKNGVEF